MNISLRISYAFLNKRTNIILDRSYNRHLTFADRLGSDIFVRLVIMREGKFLEYL